MISHTAASAVKVTAEGLPPLTGETDVRPSPDPRATSMIVTPVATAAPPKTAPQEMPERGAAMTVSVVVMDMTCPLNAKTAAEE